MVGYRSILHIRGAEDEPHWSLLSGRRGTCLPCLCMSLLSSIDEVDEKGSWWICLMRRFSVRTLIAERCSSARLWVSCVLPYRRFVCFVVLGVACRSSDFRPAQFGLVPYSLDLAALLPTFQKKEKKNLCGEKKGFFRFIECSASDSSCSYEWSLVVGLLGFPLGSQKGV